MYVMDCTEFTKTSSCKICRSANQEEKLHTDTRFLKVLNKTTFVQGYTYIHWNITFLIRTFPNTTPEKNARPKVICRTRVTRRKENFIMIETDMPNPLVSSLHRSRSAAFIVWALFELAWRDFHVFLSIRLLSKLLVYQHQCIVSCKEYLALFLAFMIW